MEGIAGFAVGLRCRRATAHHYGQTIVGIGDDPDRVWVQLSNTAGQHTALAALTAVGYAATGRDPAVVLVTGWDRSALEARAAALLTATDTWERYHAGIAEAAVQEYRQTRRDQDESTAKASVLGRVRRALRLPTLRPPADGALTSTEADMAGLDAQVRASLLRIGALELTIEQLAPALADTGEAAISRYEQYRHGHGEQAAARRAVSDTVDRVQVIRDLALHEAEHRDHPDPGRDRVGTPARSEPAVRAMTADEIAQWPGARR